MASIPVRTVKDLDRIGGCSADLVELRLDYLPSLTGFDFDLIELHRQRLILTVREPREGGVGDHRNEEKKIFLAGALERGYAVDVEADFAEQHGINIANQIVSRHYLDTDPSYDEISALVSKFNGISGITKVALRANSDSRKKLIRLLGEHDHIAVMETNGESASRILYSILGSTLLYCHAGEKTSPGQISCEEAGEIMDALGKIHP